MLKLFVVTIVCLLLFNEQVDSAVKQPPLTKEELEAISAFAELGTSVSRAAVLQNVEAVVEVIGTLGKAIPFLGPIATIVSGILGLFIHHPDELAEVKKKLTEMDSHLFAIENKIDVIVKEIVNVAEINYYREHAEKINTLQDVYQRHIDTPTIITRQSLIDNCKRNGQLEYINYVYRDLAEGGQPLLKLIKGDYDMKKFHSWTRLLVSSVSQAMFLHSVCIGLEFPNSADRQKTMAGDITHFHAITAGLAKVTRDGINDIRNNFFPVAKNEIHAYAQANQNQAHADFSKHVYDMLSNKYYWRYWFVASYSGHTAGFDKHCVAGDGMPWVYYWFRDFERSVYISSTNNPENFQVKLQQCINLHHANLQTKMLDGHILTDLYDEVRVCLGAFNGLGVVHFGNDLRAFGQQLQDPFINVALQRTVVRGGLIKQEFSVFAMAPELPH